MSAIVIDIETLPSRAPDLRAMWGENWRGCPYPPHMTPTPAPVEMGRVPSSYRNAEAIARKRAELEAKYSKACQASALKAAADCWSEWRKESLDPTRGVIHSACWTLDGEEVAAVQMSADGDDVGILAMLEHTLESVAPRYLVSWSDFDHVWLWTRAMAHGRASLARWLSDVPYALQRQLGVSSDGPVMVDAMRLWSHQYGRRPKLGRACAVLGIDHAIENPIDGSQVLDAYLDGRDEEIVDHCRADVRDLWQVWRRLAQIHGIQGAA